MKKLNKKRILFGISGGISAYKTPEIVRIFCKNGAKVRVIMTKKAQLFVTSLSLQIASNFPVFLFDDVFNPKTNAKINHIELAKWADLIILVPSTANLIARLAVGFANDLLTAVCLSTSKPIVLVPAMNRKMYQSFATQNNLTILKERGFFIWGPEYGMQICGDIGYGRMINLDCLIKKTIQFFSSKKSLKNVNILLTAGPTREDLDPVRFISNKSSGKMGFSIANAAVEKGANVTLISGPVNLPTPTGVNRINVISALDMQRVVMNSVENCDIFIGCAAVTDYRIAYFSNKKIKKKKDKILIKLKKNPDIISMVGRLKKNRPYVVGFAAETHNIKKFAKAKCINKKMDLICVNDISKKNQGFNSNTNSLYLFWKNGSIFLPLNSKMEIARQLIENIIKLYEKRNQN